MSILYNRSFYVVDDETGEIADTINPGDEKRSQEERIQGANRVKNAISAAYNKASVKQKSKEYGGFSMMRTDVKLTDMKPETVGRLAYLSTFLKYGGQLLLSEQQPYRKTTITDAERPMLKSDLPNVLRISRPTANAFYNECINAGMLEDKGKAGLFINNVFFKDTAKNNHFIKLWNKTIYQLFQNITAKQHKSFGYIVQLVPYIDKETNIVCKQIGDDELYPMTLKEICKTLNFTDMTYVTDFKKAVTSPWIEWNNTKQAICATINVSTDEGKQIYLVVNPNIMYGGSNTKIADQYGKMFRPHKTH